MEGEINHNNGRLLAMVQPGGSGDDKSSCDAVNYSLANLPSFAKD